MTREQKLALIIGFSLVLLVGVLISDHLSGARNATLADVGQALESSPPPPLDDPLPEFNERSQPIETIAATPERPEQLQHRLTQTDSTASDSFIDSLREQFHSTTQAAIPALKTEPATPRSNAEQRLPEPEVSDPIIRDQRPAAVKTYRIQAGDSLWKIADRHYGDSSLAKELGEYNVAKGRLRDPDTIRVGASILLPEPTALGGKPNLAAQRAPSQRASRSYTVKSGDTLGEIAQKQLGSAKLVASIVTANRDLIDDADDIRVGMVLKLPAS